jgi:hypothetical protein
MTLVRGRLTLVSSFVRSPVPAGRPQDLADVKLLESLDDAL